jgi:hypothetical protein
MPILQYAGLAALLSGLYPLFCAWRANRATTLQHACLWGVCAWLAWVALLLAPESSVSFLGVLALSLTGCCGVAVFGARRPGVQAWNFVVLGLLAVQLLPEGIGSLRLGPFRVLFMSATLAVGLLNYVPTRFASSAGLIALAVIVEVEWLASANAEAESWLWHETAIAFLLSAALWMGWSRARKARAVPSEIDRHWLDFRDRFGLVWGQRTREQFNRAAVHAGWPVTLYWRGIRLKRGEPPPNATMQRAIVETLLALLKRFRSSDEF